MRRREFLKTAGSFLVTASAGGLLACNNDSSPDEDRATFPFGVASGDPQPSSVMLWTRISPAGQGGKSVSLTLEVARDEAFQDIVARRDLEAGSASDYTVRVLVQELEPDTIYYYRFSNGLSRSRVGRTWTAPEPEQDTPIRFAWASCQDYSAGFYGAYRTLIHEDEARDPGERIRFVLHVGDFIYESRGESFQLALDSDLQPVVLVDRNGDPRSVPPFPSDPEGAFAQTLDDYRHLYKTFLGDPDLQDARARWPFVCVWDDHEFSNDCWQTQANYTRDDGFDEPSQRRKLAANQAWFEYIPANLIHDFTPAEVEDAPYTDPIDPAEPNNTRALASLTVYRSLRFGRHVELLLTDNRSYRSDHAIDEGITVGMPLIFHPRAAVPLAAVNAFDAGSAAGAGNPPVAVSGLPNTRRTSAPGTMLGADQKQWWKDTVRASATTFKVWGNSVPLMRIRLDTTGTLFGGDLVLSADGWDGYPSERRELMTFLKDERIPNVISLAGDHHAHFAGLVHDDADAPSPVPVMVDFAAAGISSQSQWSQVAGNIETGVPAALRPLVEPVIQLIVYDASAFGGSKAVPNLNTLIRYGAPAASVAAMTHDLAQVEQARNPAVNAHLRYADSSARGFGLAAIGADSAHIELVTIEQPLRDAGDAGLDVTGRALFTVPAVAAGEPPTLQEPALEGDKPFPLT